MAIFDNFPITGADVDLSGDDLKGYRGDTWEGVTFTVTDSAIDWTGATVCAQARPAPGQATVIEFDTSVVISGANNETITVDLAATSTKMAAVAANSSYEYDVEVSLNDVAATVVTIVRGSWAVTDDISRK